MKKILSFVRRYPEDVFLGVAFYPPLFWAVYQAMKDDTAWYIIFAACTLGWIAGTVLVHKIINPIRNYVYVRTLPRF